MEKEDKQVSSMLVQKHQLEQSENKLSELDAALNALHKSQESNDACLDNMLSDMESILSNCGIDYDSNEDNFISQEVEEYASANQENIEPIVDNIQRIEGIDFNSEMSWQEYMESVESFAVKNSIDLSVDPFKSLMTSTQRVAFEKRVKEEFSLKPANCDKYDYMIAGTCGVIGGLIDVIFGGTPKESQLTQGADKVTEKAVEKFAEANGWKGAREGSNKTTSAIGFLEGKFQINYDQATSNGRNGTDGLVKNMSTNNHHLKSLSHSPCLIGLFFSVFNQFTSSSSFVSEGKIVTIDNNFELQGSNFISKVFCGVANWFGHIMSDVSGASGIDRNKPDYGRGSGVPIPFYTLLQFINVGEFGQHKETFAKVAVKVFEQGYDLRHGIGLCIPVLITELLTRLTWIIKQRCYHKKPWQDCIPSGNNPELRRMLLVAHGSLCLIDAGDAAIRSGGDMVSFLLRTNIVGWARFGHLAIKEVYAWHNAGHIDSDAVDEYLDAEYRKMLVT